MRNDAELDDEPCCRSGAVEQLKTHCNCLGVPLFDRGYDKDPTNVAAEALKQAARDGIDIVLVDTAGRMQDNKPLMQALSMLINKNRPDLVLFVGEALVGNDGAPFVFCNASFMHGVPGSPASCMLRAHLTATQLLLA
jgi:signal recognition particle GTPase